MKKLLIRAVSGACFVAAIVLAALAGYWVAGALFFLFALFTLNEYFTLVGQIGTVRPYRALGLVSGGLLFVFVLLLCGPETPHFVDDVVVPLALVAFVALMLGAIPLKMVLSRRDFPFVDWGITVLGVFYAALPFAFALAISTTRTMSYEWQLFLFPLILVWANDTGAYCIGSAFGRHPLLPSVSPAKSWEGFWGGIVVTMGVAALLSQFTGVLCLWKWVGLGLVVALASVLGDLVESRLKRSIGVKDSGRFLPGHGGFLDRFDAMLFALPATLIYFEML